MDQVPNRLELLVTGKDEDYSMVTVSLADGYFAGVTDLYGAESIADDLIAGLEGFPRSPTDVREFTLGSEDKGVAGGWIHFICRCIDRAGHPVIEMQLNDKYAAYGLGPRVAHIHFRVEAPAIDSFVLALRTLRIELGRSVTLLGAP